MKTRSVLLLMLLMLSLLTACGKQKGTDAPDEDVPEGPQITEIKITGANFYDYFDYRDYPSFATDEDGNITECNLSCGFSLKEGLTAANDPDHKDTLKVSFTADVLSQHGEFNIDFQDASSGTVPRYEALWIDPEGTQTGTISETLPFWPQGNRTMTWQYGFLSSSYVTTIQNFTVTAVSGSIYLLRK
jgi:major membrane immunogen (membrane-anchored lipoprotein)